MWTVYAVATDGSHFYYMGKVVYGFPVPPLDREWNEYLLAGIAPGDYFVVAAPREVEFSWDAGYTEFAQCGATQACIGLDHTLVAVHVGAGLTVSGIDLLDRVDSSLIPNAGLPPLGVSTPPAPFKDLPHASSSVGGAGVQRVSSESGCAVNVPCAWLTGEVDGHAASYFTYELGTNGLFRACTAYFIETSSGWEYLDSNCRRLTTAFPAIGSGGQIAFPPYSLETGCVNVHSSPGLTSGVVACLPAGTPVTIDDGPYYLAETTSPVDPTKNLWWHLAGRGWVVHRYVAWSA